MMNAASALKVAIDLVQFPSQVKRIRSAPLPEGVVALLRIAANDQEATQEATTLAGRSSATVRKAAGFFIEQVLLDPNADSYRVLGARPDATYTELRRNMALLLRWLHPDLDPRGERSVFARRVTLAWNDLKAEDRRAAYDRARCMSLPDESSPRKKHRTRATKRKHAVDQFSRRYVRYDSPAWRHRSLDFQPLERKGLLRRVLFLIFGRVAL
jgi:hypothetical protein